MSKIVITFGDTEIEKYRFHQLKNPITIYHEKIDRIVPNKVPYCKKHFKYFLVYKDAEKVRPLLVMLPEMRF